MKLDSTGLELTETVVEINRVTKVVKGGKRFHFSALIVVGNGAGIVGSGMGKAHEVPEAIRKGVSQAKKNIFSVSLKGNTIPHDVLGIYGAGKVYLKPAVPGTGVIAGGPVRAVCEAVGIKDILTKRLGSSNKINTVRACLHALQSLRIVEETVSRRKNGNS